ncbi:MAG: glycosyltransferase family 2 protein [DPANN group archaeon]|nr:glycosyltransferase family 2 protein [DPANN group archaeon]
MLEVLAYKLVLYVSSFISLFMAIFWISILFLEEGSLEEQKWDKKYAPLVSILIPAHNEEDVIAATLDSALQVDYPKTKREIIVLANACTDRTEEIVKSYKEKGVKLISIKEPGKGYAVNIGLEKLKGEFTVILDADSIATPNLLEVLLPKFNDPNVGGVKTSIKVWKPENFLEKLQWFEYMAVGLTHKLMSVLDILYLTPGVFSIYRTDALRKVGGFDENILTEDIEIAVRLLHNGYKIKSSLEAMPFTKVPKTIEGYHGQRLRWARGFFATMLKHKEMFFKKEFGLLGLFMLPVSFAMPILIILSMLIVFYTISTFVFRAVVNILLTGRIFHGAILPLVDFSVIFWTSVLVIFSIYVLYKSVKLFREKASYPLAGLMFFIAYPGVKSFYWFLGAMYEIFGVKKVWRGNVRW